MTDEQALAALPLAIQARLVAAVRGFAGLSQSEKAEVVRNWRLSLGEHEHLVELGEQWRCLSELVALVEAIYAEAARGQRERQSGADAAVGAARGGDWRG